MARSAFFAGSTPRVIAHRGLTLRAPENSLLAFLQALSLGVTHLETDVRATRDGVAVLAHDADFRRLLGRSERIAVLSFAQLSLIDLGVDQRVASLRQALDAFPEARFNLDIKSADAVQPTVDAILWAQATGRVLVTSFSEARRRAAVAQLPGVATSASARLVTLAYLAAQLRLAPLVDRVLRNVDAVQLPERFHGVRILSERTLTLLRRNHREVHVFTVNDLAQMRRLWRSGVDGLVTDRSDLAQIEVENFTQ
ncbi:MAG: glycerophosphodiester phosphodiesterase [Microbacteriaceae bacterium]|nr:glycerophosphodiester phosphodiesterase [Microbacteriaceae bacterium]